MLYRIQQRRILDFPLMIFQGKEHYLLPHVLVLDLFNPLELLYSLLSTSFIEDAYQNIMYIYVALPLKWDSYICKHMGCNAR